MYIQTYIKPTALDAITVFGLQDHSELLHACFVRTCLHALTCTSRVFRNLTKRIYKQIHRFERNCSGVGDSVRFAPFSYIIRCTNCSK